MRFGRARMNTRKPRQGLHGSECSCGHNFNQHGYKPHPRGLTNQPPTHCVVPDCKCNGYVPREPFQKVKGV